MRKTSTKSVIFKNAKRGIRQSKEHARKLGSWVVIIWTRAPNNMPTVGQQTEIK